MLNYMNDTINHNLHLYLINPAKETDLKFLQDRDSWACQDIEKLENIVAELKQYRIELAQRVRELACMDHHTRITLKRNKNSWENKVQYFLIREKAYVDGTAEMVSQQVFKGKERHKAIEAFKNLEKEFPGFEYVECIAKEAWER